MRNRVAVAGWLLAAIVAMGADEPGKNERKVELPGLTPAGAVLLPNGWSLNPAGKQTPLGDFPVLMVENPKSPVLAILHAGYGEHEVWTLDAVTGKTIARTTIPASFSGLVWSPDGTRLYVGGGFDDVVYAFDHKDGFLSGKTTISYPDDGKKRQRVPAGLAISGDGATLYVANSFGHSLATFDAKTGTMILERAFDRDTYPYGLCLDEGSNRIYVSLWGAAKVAIVDRNNLAPLGFLATQEHPNEMLIATKGDVLFVANANRNTVSVFNTKKGAAVETINTAIGPRAPSGSTPSSLALSPDQSILFVANANTNDIAAFNVKEPGKSTPLGLMTIA